MRRLLPVLALALVALALGGCGEEKTRLCTIYRIFNGAKIPIKTVEVKNDAECNALLKQYQAGG